MFLKDQLVSVISGDPSDQHYAHQYNTDFVSRWDELIDWDKRAAGEGTFFFFRSATEGGRLSRV
jgi:GH25 family lysozyme M1 (1,4-beta-N-acetylmuramidase)